MQIKGAIRFFAIVLAIVSIYSLSFTFCTRQVEKNAREYAYNETTREEARKLSNGNPTREQVIYDSLTIVKEQYFLDSMANENIFNILVRKYTYRECKERELNLGLDLKGGMNVTLEVAVVDIVRALSDNNKDPKFNKAIELALAKQKSSQTDFVTLFVESLKEIDPNAKLSQFFLTNDLRERINYNSTDEEVIAVIREETDGAIDRTFEILRTRIDKFGVAQPNIQKLSTNGRILVELPGIKDPARVRKLLQGTAKLEFWLTVEFKEIWPKFEEANKRLKDMLARQTQLNDTLENDSLAVASTDSAKIVADTTNQLEQQLGNTSDTAQAQMDEAEYRKNNPLFSVIQPNFQNIEGQSFFGEGPLVGMCLGKDTALANKYMSMVASVFPRTVKFLWTVKPIDVKEGGNTFGLIAIKTDGKTNVAPLEGDKIIDARQDYGQNNEVEVTMTMNSDGAKIWKRLTGQNVGKCIAIVLDDYVYSYPNVNMEIPNGRSSISGNFTVEEAKDLANVLKAGKLPAPARIVEEAVVGPSLGKEAIASGLMSFLIAFVLVLLYMLFFYNKAGLAANIALIANVFFIFGVLASLGAVLTLPGIAGIVLTLGMAVDANVIIFERIKEEVRAGKGLRLAIDDGFKAAYSAIIDGNVTTLLTGVVLYIFGSGPIQGFATTLIIGILTSLFTAIFISRLFFIYLLDHNKKITFDNKFTRDFLQGTKFDFIKARKIAMACSGIVIAIGLFFLFTKGLNMGVDFSGGRSYVVRFDQDVTTNQVRDALTKELGETPEVKTFGSNNQVKITTKFMIEDNRKETDSIVEAKIFNGIKSFYAGAMSYDDFTSDDEAKVLGRLSSQKVGPTIADDIKKAAVWAVLIALIAIFVYIAIRFNKWQFGLGGVVALFHDALITISMFSIFYGILPFNLEVDQAFIAAILTIIGYSINDTVIIFDRIRENMFNFPKRDLKDNMNTAINSTLARTVNTAGTTLVVLFAILFFGGDVIRGFAFALIVGVAVGTYSSVFIASPIAYEISKMKLARKKK